MENMQRKLQVLLVDREKGKSCTLRKARDDPDLHGLNFNLRHCDLLVPHVEGQLAGGDVRRYAGFRNLGNTCFINATLQMFLNVESLRSQMRNPLCPIVVNAGYVGVATAKLRRAQQALKELELRYASNEWSAIVPVRVLQSIFGRHRTLCNGSWPAKRCYGLRLHLLRQVSACRQDHSVGYLHPSRCYNIRRP